MIAQEEYIEQEQYVEPEEDYGYIGFHIAEDSLSPVSFGYLAFLFLSLVLVVGVHFLTLRGAPESSVRPAVAVYFFILAVFLIRRLRHNRANILAPDVAFVLLYTAFHYGYLFFWSLGILPYSTGIFWSARHIPVSMLVTNLGFLGFLFGYELSSPWSYTPSGIKGVFIPSQGWAVWGGLFMVIGVLMHVTVIGIMGIAIFQQAGYTVAARMRQYGGAISILWDNSMRVVLMGSVAYCLYSALRYGRLFANKWMAIWPITFLLLITLEGDRGPLVMLGAPILLIRHYFVKRIKWRWLVVLTVVMLALFTVIGKGRGVAFAPGKILQIFFMAKEAGKVHWTDPFVELGGSWRTVNMTALLVPENEPHWHGRSWMQSAIHAVPFLEGILLRKFGFAFAGSAATWLVETFFWKGASGTGFSVAAEGYLNFGYFGAFIQCFFVAVFMRRILVYFSKKPSPVSAFVLLTMMGLLLRLPRAALSAITPYLFQAIVIAVFLKIFVGIERLQEQPLDVEAYEQLSRY